MISIEQALKIHTIAIEKFGGANGVRDLGGLESALSRPFQTFGGKDLYPTIFEKAAAIGESLIMDHPTYLTKVELQLAETYCSLT